MKNVFYGKRISGILGILPKKVVYFDDEINNYSFSEKQSKRLKKVMGYEKHRIVEESTSTSDLCIEGMNYILNNGYIKKEEIGTLIVVTVTPDYFIPHVSNIIHGECGLLTETMCIDVSQGCVGFISGLIQGFMCLDLQKDKKVVLINADVLSKKVSPKDRNSYPLIGDAAAITILENCESTEAVYCNMYVDGTRRDALKIPAGGSRMKCTNETGKMNKDHEGNIRSLDNLIMDGASIFNFSLTDVPKTIEEIIEFSNIKKEDIKYYLFHQPNKFLLQKLADALKIPYEKIFMNIVENYGNSSGATIPITILHNLSEKLLTNKYKCCLAGFGEGLSWGTCIMELGNLDFCKMVISDKY